MLAILDISALPSIAMDNYYEERRNAVMGTQHQEDVEGWEGVRAAKIYTIDGICKPLFRARSFLRVARLGSFVIIANWRHHPFILKPT